jgi:hypothetical protein
MIRFASLVVVLFVALPVMAEPENQRWAFMGRKEAVTAEPSPAGLCFVETGTGKARRRTAYILDFDGQCRARAPAIDLGYETRRLTGQPVRA